MSDLESISSIALYIAFIVYLIATLFFGATIRDKRTANTSKKNISGNIGIALTIIGFIAQLVYFITRWIAGGHVPVSNMFEFVTFLGMSLVLGFIIIYFYYRLGVLGLFALPIAMLIIAYASVFPSDLAPLVPSLQSHWLYIHVTTVSISQGILAVSFVAGLIYLIISVDQLKTTKRTVWLEIIFYFLFAGLGFVITSTTFSMMDYNVSFLTPVEGDVITEEYQMPAIVGPNNGEVMTQDKMTPIFEAPGWLKGEDAAKKLNTIVWSFLIGLVMYILARLLLRKRIAAGIQPLLRKVSPNIMDEIVYRSVAIGFPLFTLGGLIFASIWAEEAWGRFWGWDPKEVWTLITFFFYAAFLHLRLSRGWHGEKSAWLAVIGFSVIMFNIIVVNLVLAGLHSYA